VILGIESGFDQEGDIDVLRLWYRLGVRLIQFPAQVTSAYGDSAVRGGPKWGGINDRGRRLIAEMNRLGIIIDITHATEAAQRQIIEASRAPVVASHVAMRAVCNNPGNMPDDIVRAIAAKGGLVGIHSWAGLISHPAGRTFLESFQARLGAADAEPRLVRSRDPDTAEYMDALDARLTKLWRDSYAQPWREDPAGAQFVPTVDEWADHVTHAMDVAGPSHVAIGLDLSQGRSSFRDFDARGYQQLSEVLKKRNVSKDALGENWMRILDAARVQ
jgi:membrane dipeptidase